MAGILPGATAKQGFQSFLASPAGKTIMGGLAATLGLQVVAEPEVETLMREIERFLREQRKSPGGPGQKGVAVPLHPDFVPKGRPAERGKPVIDAIEKGITLLLEPQEELEPPEGEPPTRRKRRKKSPRLWFERRWDKAPGIAFQLGFGESDKLVRAKRLATNRRFHRR